MITTQQKDEIRTSILTAMHSKVSLDSLEKGLQCLSVLDCLQTDHSYEPKEDGETVGFVNVCVDPNLKGNDWRMSCTDSASKESDSDRFKRKTYGSMHKISEVPYNRDSTNSEPDYSSERFYKRVCSEYGVSDACFIPTSTLLNRLMEVEQVVLEKSEHIERITIRNEELAKEVERLHKVIHRGHEFLSNYVKATETY